MQVKVSKDSVIITDSDYMIHKGEYRANGVEYEFSSEYEGLTCKAIFNDGTNTVEVPITTGESIIPYEVLSSGASRCELRVYGYETEEVEEEGETVTKLKLRYSPAYAEFDIRRGSYIPDASSTEEITPSQFEQYSEALNRGLDEIEDGLEDINTAVNEANNLNLEVSKVDTTTTVTITKKDGTQESINIEDGTDGEDGADFEYNWNGTSLGVKTSEEQEYQYVNLKGDTGEAGHTPTRGEDYWTEQDQQQIVSEATTDVMAQISIPTKTSDLINNSGFIDNSVNNLTNYYDKTNLYTKTEIDSKISSVYKYKGSVATYSDLPSSDLTIGDVYNVESDGSNYAWNGTVWDKLGGDVDLSNYYNKTQTDTLLSGKVDNSTLNDYYTKTRADELLATKVGFTDYATSSVAGVVKQRPTHAFYVDNQGRPYCSTQTYENYLLAEGTLFIGKATLETVITGKNLETANNKVTSISNASTDTQYPSAKCVYDSQTAQNTLIEDLQEENTTLKGIINNIYNLDNYLEKVTGEGTEVTLNNTMPNAPMTITPKGNTEQDTLTGINLLTFPYYETTKTIDGITFTVKDDGTIHVEGTASARAEFLIRNRDINLNITEGETYTLATSGLGTVDSTLWLDTYGQTGNFLDKWALSQTTTYTSAVAQSKDIKPLLKITVENGATVDTDVKVWLYKGTYSSSTTYEKYCGGSPSPSPDYPQPVKVVTGNNVINIHGKNLAKSYVNGNSLNRYYPSLYVEADFEVGKKYALSFVDKSVGNSYYRNEHFMQNVQVFSITTTGERQTYYFECKSNDKTNSSVYEEGKGFNIFKNNAVLEQLPQFEDIQIEEVTSYDIPSTPYVPYVTPQTYSLNLGTIELCKIPNTNYQDIIFHAINGDSFYDTLDNATKQTLTYGKWYKHSEIGKTIFIGDSSEGWSLSSNTNYFVKTKDDLKKSSSGSEVAKGFSNYYSSNSYNSVYSGTIDYGFGFGYNSKTIAIRNKDITSLNDFKTWLSTHNVEVYYVLETPTNTEITDTDLINQLESFKSLDNQTNISSTYSENNSQMIITTGALKKI